MAKILAPHLQASLVNSTLSRRRLRLTAAAAAVDAASSGKLKDARSSSSSTATGVAAAAVRNRTDGGADGNNDTGEGVNVNCNTPLSKEGLSAALRELGIGVKAPPPSKRKGAKGGSGGGGVGRRKKEPLAGLLKAIEVSCALGLPPSETEGVQLQKRNYLCYMCFRFFPRDSLQKQFLLHTTPSLHIFVHSCGMTSLLRFVRRLGVWGKSNIPRSNASGSDIYLFTLL